MSLITASQESEQQLDNSFPYERESTIIWNPIFWVCLLMAGSAYQQLRFEVSRMAFHPYMLALGLLMFRAIPRIHHFPGRVGRPAALFLFLYVLSLIQGSSFIVQLVKIAVMGITFVIIALSVRSKEDFIAGAFGLGACAAALCVKGFIRGVGAFGSINPIEGSQKNAFSLYYLPALAICMYLLMSGMLRLNRKTILACIVTLIFGGIVLSKNRSGWLASAALMLMLIGTNRGRIKMLLFFGFASMFALGIARIVLSEADVVQERDATNATRSDWLRLELFQRAVIIGLQHPLLGVSPTRLTRILGSELVKFEEEGSDCHNLTGYLIGGCGLFTFGAFCLFVYCMAFPPGRVRLRTATRLMKESSKALTVMTLIWLLRAQFQEDTLFSPTFTAGLGLCVGFCISSGVYQKGKIGQEPSYLPEAENLDHDRWSTASPYDSPREGKRPVFGGEA
jgi:hypothetical protein